MVVKGLSESCIMWGDVMDASNYEQGGVLGNKLKRVGWEVG